MNAEETELCFWSVLVVIFFGCIATALCIDDRENLFGQAAFGLAVILAVPLAIRFRWFRIMMLIFFALILFCVWGTNKKKDRD